jgi:hypothetical protein
MSHKYEELINDKLKEYIYDQNNEIIGNIYILKNKNLSLKNLLTEKIKNYLKLLIIFLKLMNILKIKKKVEQKELIKWN